MIKYPQKLNTLFEKLQQAQLRPIIVGGYVRDAILKRESKDIDIEVYNVNSLDALEKILKNFAEVSSVGKSFGVCKLKLDELELDFSLPREDSKVSSGHRGFEIKTDASLDFTIASNRRDFTMNALGYDVFAKRLLDPHNGIKDIQEGIIRAVNLKKFGEDPLRVLRLVQFASRFEFRVDETLFEASKRMVTSKVLEELPKERIFEEIKKLLLKSKKPSHGIKLLKELGTSLYFEEFYPMLDALDYLAQKKIEDANAKLTLMLTLLSSKFTKEKATEFLELLTDKKELHRELLALLESKKIFDIYNYSEYDLYKLATLVEIEKFLYMSDALTLGVERERIIILSTRAKELGILHQKAVALIEGRDLIHLGLEPSPQFSTLLAKAYEAQMHSEFQTHEQGVFWVKRYLSP